MLLLFFVFAIASVKGQVQHGGTPNWNVSVEDVPSMRLPAIDRDVLDAQDAVTDQYKEAPWRFGVEFAVDISPSSAGVWTEESGLHVWRMKFETNDALGLSFFFDEYRLPKGGELYIWNSDR